MTILTRIELVGRHLGRKVFPRKSIPSLDYDPYDKTACESRANRLLELFLKEPRRGPLETCQRIMTLIGASYPTERLAAEYFTSLDGLLGGMPRLDEPGQLVIGLGPGRCGSTSLAGMLGTVGNSCCTHENPPLIFWTPQSEQVDFHTKRFRILVNYYSLVADVSHWWLNAFEQVLDQFPEAKFIGLVRDPDECAMSFMRVQGFGRGSHNPWAMRGNDFWRTGPWDPTYPSYSPAGGSYKNPDRAKLEAITRYVQQYNSRLEEIARSAPDKIKLVPTADLGRATVQQEIFRIAKGPGKTSTWRLNVKGTADSRSVQIKL